MDIDAAFLRREHNSVMSVDPEPTLELQGLDELVELLICGSESSH